METRPTNKFLNTILVLVRGPMFLSVCSFILLLITIPAQSTVLRGYLNATDTTPEAQTEVQATQPDTSVAGPPEPLTEARPATVQLEQVAMAARTAPIASPESRQSALQQAMLSTDSFPSSFAGAWNVVTVVVDSAVGTVPTGEQINSQVAFVHTDDGRVVAKWEQPGWTEARARITPVNEREASLDRTNYYVPGRNGAWAAHSEDHYVQIDANRMSATSFVDQYIDGQYLGRYRTRSMLYRATGNMALARQ